MKRIRREPKTVTYNGSQITAMIDAGILPENIVINAEERKPSVKITVKAGK